MALAEVGVDAVVEVEVEEEPDWLLELTSWGGSRCGGEEAVPPAAMELLMEALLPAECAHALELLFEFAALFALLFADCGELAEATIGIRVGCSSSSLSASSSASSLTVVKAGGPATMVAGDLGPLAPLIEPEWEGLGEPPSVLRLDALAAMAAARPCI